MLTSILPIALVALTGSIGVGAFEQGSAPVLRLLANGPQGEAAQGGADRWGAIWDGVYTAGQAMRGKAEYERHCSLCHGESLTGKDGPSLVGDDFERAWREDNLDSVFSRIKATMPADRPGSLGDRAYVDITAYLLQENAFPVGTEELTPNPDLLRSIQIVAREGPGLLPNFAMVAVVGCLEQSPDNTWLLTHASDPARTRNPEASETTELEEAAARALGSRTFRLINVYPSPDAHKGRKMEVKGFLIRVPNDDRLNPTALQVVASRCER